MCQYVYTHTYKCSKAHTSTYTKPKHLLKYTLVHCCAYSNTFKGCLVLECNSPPVEASVEETSPGICMSYTPVIKLWQKKRCQHVHLFKVELILFFVFEVLNSFFNNTFGFVTCALLGTLKCNVRRTLARYSLDHKSPNVHFSLWDPLDT